MENAWFVLTHKYSMSTSYDAGAVELFRADLDAAARLNVKWIVMESYPRDFAYGDYTTPWNEDTLRALVDSAHEAGFRVIPYTNATEVDVKSSIYRERRDWLAKPPVGREYSAFISCYLPEYFKEGDFFNKLVCPAGPWRDYYLDQCDALMEKYGFDGIYVDRVDYRVPCASHPGFSDAIPEMTGELGARIKRRGADKILVINDSYKIPDKIFRRTMANADIVLMEILPPGTVQEINNVIMFLTSDMLHALKPMTELLVGLQLKSWAGSPVPDAARIERRVKMISRVTRRPIWIATHAISAQGLRNIHRVARRTGQNICIISPESLARSEHIPDLLEG